MNTLIHSRTLEPIKTGDVVHVHGKAFVLHHADSKSGYLSIMSIDDRPQYRTVFPKEIGARWEGNTHVHPAMMEALQSCFRS